MPPWMHDASQLVRMLRVLLFLLGPYMLMWVGQVVCYLGTSLPTYLYLVLLRCNLLGLSKGTLPPT